MRYIYEKNLIKDYLNQTLNDTNQRIIVVDSMSFIQCNWHDTPILRNFSPTNLDSDKAFPWLGMLTCFIFLSCCSSMMTETLLVDVMLWPLILLNCVYIWACTDTLKQRTCTFVYLPLISLWLLTCLTLTIITLFASCWCQMYGPSWSIQLICFSYSPINVLLKVQFQYLVFHNFYMFMCNDVMVHLINEI